MLVRSFRQNQPAVLFLLLVLVPVLWPGVLTGEVFALARLRTGMPLARMLAHMLELAPWVPWFVGMLFTVGCALLLDKVASDAELFDRRNHLPALLFPLMMALAPQGMWVGPAFLGLPFVLWAFARTWSIQGRTTSLGPLFDAGLLLGMAALCYFPYIFLVVVVWASVAVMRPFQWREYIVPFVGLLVPYYLAWGVSGIIDLPAMDPLRTLAGRARSTLQHPTTLWSVLVLLVFVPLLLKGLANYATLYTRSIVREKNVRSAFLAASLALAILFGFESLLNRTYPAALLAVPLAVIGSHAVLRPGRDWLSEMAVWWLLTAALWMRWMG
ncbi:MAG: hypothetical protein IT229_06065 [Flavobacteriales bacterium]|nr:hypothetical protein [Flavobacteriales bacterium]